MEILPRRILESIYADTMGDVFDLYRRPQQALDAPNEALMESFCWNQHKHWVFACDWNLDPASDPLASVMTSFCGQLGSSSGHKRSTHPTDSVWFSQSLSCEKQSPMDALSDHFGSFVELGQIPCLDPSPPAWIFKSVARFQDNCDLPSADEAAQAWHHVSTPSEVWGALVQQDINDAWSTWSSDAEVFLKRIGAVSHESSAAQRGSLPTLVSGPSRHGPGQSITERRLRRVIRRLDEAQRHVHNGTSVPTNLQRTCQRNCNQFGCGADAQAHRWGACLKELTEQLKLFLKQSNLHALQGWRQKVQTYEGACAWLRKQAPPSWALTNGDKNTSSRSQGAAFLFESWKNNFLRARRLRAQG